MKFAWTVAGISIALVLAGAWTMLACSLGWTDDMEFVQAGAAGMIVGIMGLVIAVLIGTAKGSRR